MADKPTDISEHIFIRRVLIVLGLSALAFILWQLRGVVLMLFGAVVVASVFRALADIFRNRLGVPDAIAVAASVILILGGIGVLAAVFGAEVSRQVGVLGEKLPVAWQSFERRVGEMGLGEALGSASTSLHPASVSAVGGSQPHENMSPFLVLNFIVALQGVFPSRN